MSDKPILTMPDGKRYEVLAMDEIRLGDTFLTNIASAREFKPGHVMYETRHRHILSPLPDEDEKDEVMESPKGVSEGSEVESIDADARVAIPAAKSHDYPLIDPQRIVDALTTAWGLIVNGKALDSRDRGEWIDARSRWRDEQFHPLLELFTATRANNPEDATHDAPEDVSPTVKTSPDTSQKEPASV